MLEVGGMAETGGQEDDVRHLAAGGLQGLEGAAFQVEKRAEPGDAQGLELVRKQAGGDVTVFQHLAEAAGDGGEIAQDRPVPARAADEVTADGDDMAATDRLDAARILQESGAGVDEIGRQQAFPEELLRTVDVRQHGIDEPDALGQTSGDPRPILRRDQQRHRIQFVWLADAAGVAVDIEGRAEVRDHAAGRRGNRVALLGAPALDFQPQTLPVRAELAPGVDHFLPHGHRSGRRGQGG